MGGVCSYPTSGCGEHDPNFREAVFRIRGTIRANRQDSKPSAVSLAWAHEPLKRLSEKSSVSARYNSTRFVDSTLRGMCSRMPILKRPASKVLQPATASFTWVASRGIIRVFSARARR